MVFEADTVSASYVYGQFLGLAKDTGNALLNQQVAAIEGPTLWTPQFPRHPLAIGRCVQDTSSSTKVWVEILSGMAS